MNLVKIATFCRSNFRSFVLFSKEVAQTSSILRHLFGLLILLKSLKKCDLEVLEFKSK